MSTGWRVRKPGFGFWFHQFLSMWPLVYVLELHFLHVYNGNSVTVFLTSHIIVGIQEDNECEDALWLVKHSIDLGCYCLLQSCPFTDEETKVPVYFSSKVK